MNDNIEKVVNLLKTDFFKQRTICLNQEDLEFLKFISVLLKPIVESLNNEIGKQFNKLYLIIDELVYGSISIIENNNCLFDEVKVIKQLF